MTMETLFAQALSEHWPALLGVAALLFGLFVCARFLSLTFESVGRALGPIGRWFRAQRAISQAEADHMRRQIVALDERVRALLYRDECYFAYMLTDAEWHRRYELTAASKGWVFEPHVSFLQFRDRWMRERGLGQEIEIWT